MPHLPDSVATADVLAALDEGEGVPDGAAAGVAHVGERVGAGRLLLAGQPQLLPDALHHASPAWRMENPP